MQRKMDHEDAMIAELEEKTLLERIKPVSGLWRADDRKNDLGRALSFRRLGLINHS